MSSQSGRLITTNDVFGFNCAKTWCHSWECWKCTVIQ